MSIKVNDLFKLPSMRNAKLIAGIEGKNNIVNSISVLESTDPALLQGAYFQHEHFRTDEILITGFINNPNKFTEQCDCIRGLHNAGASGLIIFYVGIFMSEIDKDLIDLANELGFPLICMPPNCVILYGEVITDVLGSIFREKQLENHFVGEFLDRMSKLSEDQRTLDYLLRLISNHTQYSLALFDRSLDILHAATWPMSDIEFFSDLIVNKLLPSSNGMIQTMQCENGQETHYVFCRLVPRYSTVRMLVIVSENAMIIKEYIEQIIELIQLFISIWIKRHDPYAKAELVQAIIKNEPLKLRRLSEIFRINIQNLQIMWIFSVRNIENDIKEKILSLLEPFMEQLHLHFIYDIHDANIVIFIEKPTYTLNLENMVDTFLIEVGCTENNNLIVVHPKLADMTQAREILRSFEEYEPYVRKVYPFNKMITLAQLSFVEQCMNIVTRGEECINKYLLPLQLICPEEEEWHQELIHTLSAFLLDAESSVTQAANILYVHKSTIKYRIRSINEALGYNISKLPESYPLYLALAIKRLLD
jgi:DNA-binding PucR family transcriptional regulator